MGGVPTIIYPLDNCFNLKYLLANMLAFLNIVALKLHLCLRHLMKLTKYEWPVGGGEVGSLFSSRKATSANQKKGQTISVT